MRWTPEYVRQRFPAEVRELRRAEGESLNIKPTHKWLREHGFSGIQGYAERNEKTVDDVLLEECGFDQREKKPLPGTHAETKELIHQWLQDEDEKFSRLNDTSVSNTWTHMRRLMEISRDALGSSNLLRPARAPSGKNVRLTVDLLGAMNDEFKSEGTRYNYASTLGKFYEYLEMFGEVDSNPVEKVLPRMGWTYTRESPANTLTPEQVQECWKATKSIDEESVEDLDTETLRERLVEKVLLLSLAACGERTSEPLMINAHEDIILDPSDPRVCFDHERKNDAGTVPIMAGLDYFEQYIELLDEEGYEMLFPSEQSADGTRSDSWVGDRIEEIVDRAGVRFPDGSKPKPGHFRQFWFNEYINAYEAYIAKIEDVAAEQSSASAEIVDKHYIASRRERDNFRRFACAHFETAFPTDVVVSPEEIAEARNDSNDNPQTTIGDFTGAWAPGAATALVSTKLTEARVHRERVALEHDWAVSTSSPQFVASLIITVLGISVYYAAGLILMGVDPIGDPSTIPIELILALPLAVMTWIFLAPNLEEPDQRTNSLIDWFGLRT